MSQLTYQHFAPTGLRAGHKVSNSSRVILVEAEKHGIRWEIIPGTEIVELDYKGKVATFHYQIPSTTTSLAEYSCNNKHVTNNVLTAAGISVPKGYQVRQTDSPQYIKKVYKDLQKPLVVKPTNGSHGDQISLNISSYAEYQQALRHVFTQAQNNDCSIVEEMFAGQEYRILATQEKVIGILHRVPANVIGDGKSSINELIARKNREKIRRNDGTRSHVKIEIDTDILLNIAEYGLTLHSIPKRNQQVFLRKVSNISKGGEAIDYTDIAHPSVSTLALEAMRAMPGLSFAGIDLMTTDISQAQTDSSYKIIEINASPGLDIHDSPYQGKNRQAAREFLWLLFPELKNKMRHLSKNNTALDSIPSSSLNFARL